MELEGKINISRIQKSNGNQYIELSLEDVKAGITFVKAALTLEDFAKALTGQGYIDTTIDVSMKALALVGTTREVKTEFVPGELPYENRRNETMIQKMVAPFTLGGWEARKEDLTNYHTSKVVNGIKGHNVVFTRNVKACDV